MNSRPSRVFAWSIEARRALDSDGFARVDGLVREPLLAELAGAFRDDVPRAGRRDGLRLDAVRALVAAEPIRAIVRMVLGPQAFAIRATLFDKTPAANWLVAWHQDVTVAVRARREVPGFAAWSVKAGVVHARAPAAVLASMLAIRVEVDGTDATRGPLRVIPGSHAHGILDRGTIERLTQATAAVECLVPAGGALLMRPLLLHASSRASVPGHRRVVHLEFASGELPDGLAWHERGPAVIAVLVVNFAVGLMRNVGLLP